MTIIVNMKTVVSRRIFTMIEDSTIARSGLWITPKRWNETARAETHHFWLLRVLD